MLDNDGLNALIFQKRQKFTTLFVQAGADFLDETINLNSVQRRPFRDARDLAVGVGFLVVRGGPSIGDSKTRLLLLDRNHPMTNGILLCAFDLTGFSPTPRRYA